MNRKLLILFALLISILIKSSYIFAADDQILIKQSPVELIENLTTNLIKLVEKEKLSNTINDIAFYKQLESLLRPVIHESFSRRIMGKYGNEKYILSLPKDKQKKIYSQIYQFDNVLLGSLTSTYGKGLLAFDGQKIEVIELVEYKSKSKTMVKQLIYGDRKEPYEVIFALKKIDDQWKIGNFRFEQIDFGRIYKKQFKSLLNFYNDDVDLVIKNWTLSRLDKAS